MSLKDHQKKHGSRRKTGAKKEKSPSKVLGESAKEGIDAGKEKNLRQQFAGGGMKVQGKEQNK